MIERSILPSFATPFLRVSCQCHFQNQYLLSLDSRHLHPFHVRTPFHARAVILGGNSGVGKEIAKYLESQGTEVRTASRRSGYDFLYKEHVLKALHGQTRAAISVGAGHRGCSPKDELQLYQSIAAALSSSSQLELVTVVLRALIVPEVQAFFQQMVNVPWVFVRPGPLVEREQTQGPERILVTTDIRCNGLVSRAAVGRVVGDLLVDKVPISSVAGQILGVFDLDRMINHPQGIEVIGKNIWR